MATFHDVIRHLVHHGPFASDAEREEALKAVDEHEAATTAASRGSKSRRTAPADPDGDS